MAAADHSLSVASFIRTEVLMRIVMEVAGGKARLTVMWLPLGFASYRKFLAVMFPSKENKLPLGDPLDEDREKSTCTYM